MNSYNKHYILISTTGQVVDYKFFISFYNVGISFCYGCNTTMMRTFASTILSLLQARLYTRKIATKKHPPPWDAFLILLIAS